MVVGLGNPGPRYSFNRHNVGFMTLDRYSAMNNCNWLTRENYVFANCEDCWLLKPMTYMNLSGVAVKEFLKWSSLSANNLIVVYDDVDLPCGRLRIRKKGSSGGHKGVESIIREIGSSDFVRIRLGIGPKPRGISLADFVLQDFTDHELQIVDKVIDAALSALKVIITEGTEKAMSVYNSYEVIV